MGALNSIGRPGGDIALSKQVAKAGVRKYANRFLEKVRSLYFSNLSSVRRRHEVREAQHLSRKHSQTRETSRIHRWLYRVRI